MSILLERGQRGIIIGQTGSGKTVGAIWHMQHVPVTPIVIMDTKGEPAFDKIGIDEETQVYESLADFEREWFKKRRQPVYSIVRPDMSEIAEPAGMDETLFRMVQGGRGHFLYIDEAYQWHVAGRAGAGLTGILTRGRSKGITTLLSTQRPAWLSRFCFTEAQKMYIYRLNDKRDAKTIGEYVPDFAEKPIAKRYEWYYYDVLNGELKRYSPVKITEGKAKAVGADLKKRVWF